MNELNKRLRTLWNCITYVTLTTGLFFYNSKIFAGPAGYCTYHCHSCYVIATSTNASNPAPTNTIYDDGNSGVNFFAYYAVGGFGSWNCGNQFLIREYVGNAISLDFGYENEITANSSTDPTSAPVSAHDIVITNLTTSTSTTISGYADQNADYTDHTFTFSNTQPGEYLIQYFRPGVIAGTVTPYAPDITCRIVLIRPITSLSITAAPICNNFSAPTYVFQAHATPDFSSILFASQSYGQNPTPAVGCDDQCNAENFMTIDFSASQSSTGNPLLVNNTGAWSFTSLCQGTPAEIPGFNWTPSVASSTDINDYYINYSTPDDPFGLASYLVYNTTGNYGATPIINLTVSDGISTYTASAPITIITPPTITDIDINTRCAPGSAGATAPAPKYSVTVTGGTGGYSYLWTPISSVISGGGGTYSVPDYVTLDHYDIADPTITGIGHAYFHGVYTPIYKANYMLTVTDGSGCQTSQHVQNTLITSGFDLASRDSHFDLYDEPNSQPDLSDIFSSPDIWNRLIDDGLMNQENQAAEYIASGPGAGVNWLNVKVRNVGCVDYDNSTITATLNNYWTMGESPETWPYYWTGGDFTACDGSHQLIGYYLSSSIIPSIPAGGSTIVQNSWTTPNPNLYYPSSCPSLPPYYSLCFLATILDGHNPACTDGMTTCEATTGSISPNISNNNNIASRNTAITYVGHLRHSHTVVVGNGGVVSDNFSLQFVNGTVLQPGTGISTLSNYISAKVFLGDLYDIWSRAGAYGTYAAVDANEKSVTFDGSNTMRLDSINLDTGIIYPVEIEFDLLPGVNGENMPNETVSFRQLNFSAPVRTLIDSGYTVSIDTSLVSSVDSTYDSVIYAMVYDTVYSSVFDTVYTTVYDTTYRYDTVYGGYSFQLRYKPPPPPCPGVLTVTELSNGPATTSISAQSSALAPVSGCDYGELTVSNCGICNSPTVNVQGWIIDDNSGNFNLSGCTIFGGITQSHYRLAYDATWGNVPVGSTIIVYNADSNCYNLPDSFTITANAGTINTSFNSISLGNTYWVPLGGATTYPLGTPHIQRFQFTLDSSLCNYVVDTITTASDSTYDSTYYTYGGNWQNTINFDSSCDAFQVRCPRCGHDMNKQPEFYHGFGYGPGSGPNQFGSIPPDTACLGGPVINSTGRGYKYCFTGSSAADLGNPAQWQQLPADAGGAVPPTLGNVNSGYGQNIQQNLLNLPCCSPTSRHHSDSRNGNSGGGSGSNGNIQVANNRDQQSLIQGLNVYPIPTSMVLNFQYSQQDNITIRITDVVGRKMDEQTLQNSTLASFNVASYTPGIYLYQVITNGKTQSGKVIVE